MSEEIETNITTEADVRLSLSEWDDGAWISLRIHGASMYTALTRAEAEQLLAGLQAILAKEKNT